MSIAHYSQHLDHYLLRESSRAWAVERNHLWKWFSERQCGTGWCWWSQSPSKTALQSWNASCNTGSRVPLLLTVEVTRVCHLVLTLLWWESNIPWKTDCVPLILGKDVTSHRLLLRQFYSWSWGNGASLRARPKNQLQLCYPPILSQPSKPCLANTNLISNINANAQQFWLNHNFF